MLVVGYPKSGNTWFSYLLAYCLNVPYDNLMEPGVHPRDAYQRSLVKGGLPHRSFQEITPGVWTTHDLKVLREQKGKDFTVYILRDGRDVMVSYYFYLYRFLEEEKRQQKSQKTTLRERLRRWIRPGAHAQAPPTFLEFVRQRAPEWRDHVEQALEIGPDAVVKYEDLRQDPVATLQEVFSRLGAPVETSVIQAGVEAFRFEKLSGRQAGYLQGKI